MIAILKAALLFAGLLAVPAADAVQQAADSGRCATVAEKPDARVTVTPTIAPGPPPLLSFRYYEGKAHHRFGNADLMLDDAGH
jgi:hypothetical protein